MIVSNVSALVAGVLLYVLARREGRDAAFATRATWFLALAPRRVRPRHGLHGIHHDRAGDRHVPRPAQPKRWWIAAGARRARRAEPPVRVPARRPGARRGGARAPRPPGEGVRRPRPPRSSAPAVGTLALPRVGLATGSATSGSRTRSRPKSSRRGLVRQPARHGRRRAATGCSTATRSAPGCTCPGWSLVARAARRLLPHLARELRRARGRGDRQPRSSRRTSTRSSATRSPRSRSCSSATSLTASRRIERAVLVLSGAAMTIYALLAFLHAYVP